MITQIYDVEVDVAIARPPSKANTRTVFTRVAVPLDMPNFQADAEAHLIAIAMVVANPRVVMAVGSRITRLEL